MRLDAAFATGVAGLLLAGWMVPNVLTYRDAVSVAVAVSVDVPTGAGVDARRGGPSDAAPGLASGVSPGVAVGALAGTSTEPAAELTVSAVGLTTPVGTMRVPADRVIRPPTFDAAYEIVDPANGYPGQSGAGTVFVALHSSSAADHADAPGNALVRDGRSTVHVGDAVTLRDETFTVTQVLTHAKGDLAATDEVWEQHEGRLVLVTCVPRPGHASGADNLVVIAERR